jgi:hypothetical protein
MEALGQLFVPVVACGLLFLVTVIDILVRKGLGPGAKSGWILLSLIPLIGPLIYAVSAKRRFVLIFFILVVLGLAAFYGTKYYLNHKPRRDVNKEQGIAVTAEELFQAFKMNEDSGYRKYRDSAIQVTGEVDQVTTNQNNQKVVYLKTSDPMVVINCTFKEDPGPVQKGQSITFKGICTGYIADANVIINEGVIVRK